MLLSLEKLSDGDKSFRRGIVAWWIICVGSGVHYLLWRLAFGKRWRRFSTRMWKIRGTGKEWIGFHFALGNALAVVCYYFWGLGVIETVPHILKTLSSELFVITKELCQIFNEDL